MEWTMGFMRGLQIYLLLAGNEGLQKKMETTILLRITQGLLYGPLLVILGLLRDQTFDG